ncbi:selenoprotein T2-like [Coregonus clupeaformis]|uniref:selenoprotein T2-like n=1 Tax=Coregonus clupeaformis TaxID=59861 RepID=UPI001E1C53C4|nr:selenoprotein T2-like [Coregonus clupeaformis]
MGADSLRDADPQRLSKQTLYTGPVLKFQFCISGGYSKVFQEYSRSISQLYLDIHIEGDNYPPHNHQQVSGHIIAFKLLAIALVVSGQNPFPMLGLDTPRVWTWSQENKIFSCLMTFFLSNMLETHFLSTGAFEITLNDIPIWSKLQLGYVPNIQEERQSLTFHPDLTFHPYLAHHRRPRRSGDILFDSEGHLKSLTCELSCFRR